MTWHYNYNAVGAPTPIAVAAPRAAGTTTVEVSSWPAGLTYPTVATFVRGTDPVAILEITGAAGTTLTTTGALEGFAGAAPTDVALRVGDSVYLAPTAGAVAELQAAIDAITTGDGATGVVPGHYTLADVTVDARGRITDAVSGTPPVASVFGRTGIVAAATGDYTVSQVAGAAPLDSPAFTGTPTAPTPTTADNSTAVATTAYVQAQGYLTAAPVTSVAGRTGAIVLATADVAGLGTAATHAATDFQPAGNYLTGDASGHGFPRPFTFGASGTPAVGPVNQKLSVPYEATLVAARAAVDAAPSGGAFAVDLEASADGSTGWTAIWSSANRLSIAAGAGTGSASTFAAATLAAGSYLRINYITVNGATNPVVTLSTLSKNS